VASEFYAFPVGIGKKSRGRRFLGTEGKKKGRRKGEGVELMRRGGEEKRGSWGLRTE